jgi:anti-sigma-K factor RskA
MSGALQHHARALWLAAALIVIGGLFAGTRMPVSLFPHIDFPRVVVSMHPHHMLRVQTMHPWPKAAGKSLELWAMPKDGPPRSLGLVHNEVSDTLMPMPENDTRMRGALSLVVSLEPPGGSPKPWPTGPVLCSGPIAPMTRT